MENFSKHHLQQIAQTTQHFRCKPFLNPALWPIAVSIRSSELAETVPRAPLAFWVATCAGADDATWLMGITAIVCELIGSRKTCTFICFFNSCNCAAKFEWMGSFRLNSNILSQHTYVPSAGHRSSWTFCWLSCPVPCTSCIPAFMVSPALGPRIRFPAGST